MMQNILAIIGLEVAVMRLMKMDQYGYLFARRQRSLPSLLYLPALKQVRFLLRQKSLTKIIDRSEQFD
jgi:hypothetical protein